MDDYAVPHQEILNRARQREESDFLMGYIPKRPAPISHPPEHWEGWSGRWPGLRRVIATVHWTDDTITEHRTHAQEWTRDRVRVIIESDHDPPGRNADLWLPATDIRRNDDRPQLGEIMPAPEYGPTYIKEATQEDVDNWPNG